MNQLVVTVGALGLTALASYTLGPQHVSRPSRTRTAPLPPARTEQAVPFRVGETLTYDVSWSSYITAGVATMTVKEKKPSFNSTAYYIVAEGRPTPLVSKLYTLYYKIDTLVDAYTLLPQRASLYSEEGSRHRFKVTQFNRAAKQAHFESQSMNTAQTDFAVSPVVQDGLSALYVLRAIPFKFGDRMTMPITEEGQTYGLRLDIGRPELLKVPFGELSAIKVNPTLTDDSGKPFGRNMAIWLSDDARRLPLKIQAELSIGSFVLALRTAQ